MILADPARRVLAAALIALFCFACGDDDASAPAPDPGEPFELAVLEADVTGLDFVQRSGTAAQRHIVEVKSTGVGLMDVDGDGRLDVVLTSGSTIERALAGEPGFGTRVFRNLGGMRFEDVTASTGLPTTDWAQAPVCADWDGDGRTDLLVTQFGRARLFRNLGGRFEEVTESSGVDVPGWSTSAAFHDIDDDGDLDLYVCRYLDFDLANPPADGRDGRNCVWKEMPVMCGPKGLPPRGDLVFENLGGGRFADRTREWGIAALPPSYGLGVVAGDLDGDGATEIYVANDGMANFWLDWTGKGFEENGYFNGVALNEDGVPEAGMGVDARDLDGDGREEIVCTNFSNEMNNLFYSREDGMYVEASERSGTGLPGLTTLGWGVGLVDFDLDGRPDLFVANGHVYPEAARPNTGTDYRQPALLFLGAARGRFDLVDAGRHPALGIRKVARGAAFGDLDDDGDVDVVLAVLNERPTVIENRLDRARLGRKVYGARLVGPEENTDGIGAVVRLESAGGAWLGSATARRQASFQCSNDPRVVFGAAPDGPRPARFVVRWPDGRAESFPVQPDGYARLVHGKGETVR